MWVRWTTFLVRMSSMKPLVGAWTFPTELIFPCSRTAATAATAAATAAAAAQVLAWQAHRNSETWDQFLALNNSKLETLLDVLYDTKHTPPSLDWRLDDTLERAQDMERIIGCAIS